VSCYFDRRAGGSAAYGHGMGGGKIKFTWQYQPVRFGDKPSRKTVDGKRIAALQAAEDQRAINR
jgi:hypothetical protein